MPQGCQRPHTRGQWPAVAASHARRICPGTRGAFALAAGILLGVRIFIRWLRIFAFRRLVASLLGTFVFISLVGITLSGRVAGILFRVLIVIVGAGVTAPPGVARVLSRAGFVVRFGFAIGRDV